MERPKKKVFKNNVGFLSLTDREFGYNKGIQAMIDFMPSKIEIHKIIKSNIGYDFDLTQTTNAIHKRLGGKNE